MIKSMRHGFFLVGLAFLLLALPLFVFLALQRQENRQHAQQATEVLLIPSNQSAKGGEKLSIQVDINAVTDPVTSIQLTLVYPIDKLILDRTEEGSTAFETPSENLVHNGLLRIGRETMTPVIGRKHVMTLHFNVIKDMEFSEITSAPGSPMVLGINSVPLTSTITYGDKSSEVTPPNTLTGFQAIIATIAAFLTSLNPL